MLDPAEIAVVMARALEPSRQDGNHDDMLGFMKERASFGRLDKEERDLFAAAVKGSVQQRRNALRRIEQERDLQVQRGEDAKVRMAEDYMATVKAEFMRLCEECVTILSEQLLPNADAGEAKAFLLKMQADYYRYEHEFANEAKKKRVAHLASTAYLEAFAEAKQHLFVHHPLSLQLVQNYSVFQHEVLMDLEGAIKTAQDTLLACHARLPQMPEEAQIQAGHTLQVVKDNLRSWQLEKEALIAEAEQAKAAAEAEKAEAEEAEQAKGE